MDDDRAELQRKVDELEDKVARMVIDALEGALTAGELEERAARLTAFTEGRLGAIPFT